MIPILVSISLRTWLQKFHLLFTSVSGSLDTMGTQISCQLRRHNAITHAIVYDIATLAVVKSKHLGDKFRQCADID